MGMYVTELRRRNFADSMYRVIFPDAPDPRDQAAALYELLWKKIVDQELRPGDGVVEAAIADETGVSRTPVREALQRLVQDGLLEQRPRGVRVAMATPEATVDLYDYRAALETFAARRAALRLPPGEIQRSLDEGEVLSARLGAPGGRHDPQVAHDSMRQDLRLHHLLLRSAGNANILRAMAAIQARLSLFQVAGTRIPGRMEQTQQEHRAILQALLAQDAAGAGSAMAAHIEQVKAHILADVFGRQAAPTGERAVAC